MYKKDASTGSKDGDDTWVSEGAGANGSTCEEPAVPTPRSLQECSTRGALRNRVYDYVNHLSGAPDDVDNLGQEVRLRRDLKELSELIDAEAPPIPAFDDEKPVFKTAQKKFRLDGLMDILRHESRAENTTRVVKGFAMAAMTGAVVGVAVGGPLGAVVGAKAAVMTGTAVGAVGTFNREKKSL